MDSSKKSKTRLYLDIDGVIYGWYGGQWQIRPYTATLINWAKKHFDVKFLSFNGRNEMISKVCYIDPILKCDMSHDSKDPLSSLKRASKSFSSLITVNFSAILFKPFLNYQKFYHKFLN